MFKAPSTYAFLSPGPLLSLRLYKALKTQFCATGHCGIGSQFGTTQNRRPASLSHSTHSPASCERYTELLALLLRIRESRLQMSVRRQATVIEIFRGFSESLQVRLRHGRLRPIPSAFPHSLVTGSYVTWVCTPTLRKGQKGTKAEICSLQK